MAIKNKKDLSSAGNGVFDKIFSESTREAADSGEEKAVNDTQKSVKKVFSFRGPSAEADKWRLYADAKGMKVDELGTSAISEYIKNHPLSEDEEQVYNTKLRQKKG